MEQGWDPEVARFFRKILHTISYGLIWMMSTATAGLYFELGYRNGKPLIYVIIFYICVAGTLFLLLRYYYRLWKK